MNRAETEDGSYASARNRKLLAAWAAKAGENEYAEPALNPCQTTAFEFFTDDRLLYRRGSRPARRARIGLEANRVDDTMLALATSCITAASAASALGIFIVLLG